MSSNQDYQGFDDKQASLRPNLGIKKESMNSNTDVDANLRIQLERS